MIILVRAYTDEEDPVMARAGAVDAEVTIADDVVPLIGLSSDDFIREDEVRARAIRAVVAAQWLVMVTLADWCAAFALDPETDADEPRFSGFAGCWAPFMNLGALPTPEQVVDGLAAPTPHNGDST